MDKTRIGVIGCGNISDIYLKNLRELEGLEVVAIADLYYDKAIEKAREYAIPEVLEVDQLLEDKSINLVINLTIPAAHADVSLRALESGKHVYVEKPLAISLEDGKRVLAKAEEKGLLVGSAPDTFLGGGLQTCKKLIEDGAIGEPIAATAFMMGHGPESWHPDPEFFYRVGAGPMFDMGPYYLTALINLIGPVRRLTGSARVTSPERKITSEPKFGEKIKVETPTHVAGIIDFENGAIGTLVTSFDVWGSKTPFLEIYGTEGSLSVPDPNTFGGPVLLRKSGELEWVEVAFTHGSIENSRGIGVIDMVNALKSGRLHRASGELAYHVLEIMHGIHESSLKGEHYHMTSTCRQPESLPSSILS
ncbi:Gfo/Idh/MocA family protein [Pseudalkalibacillus hwajinpoensis]|uniref:Gfo/Idh/MocA family oxidoreductase n=1 Tax=Guptibacillus hwajinpoensis TaxID=208199 RepID=A0A4U1MJS7_9BACL|nr:Gfo/Idh/MocA family oxidoreductase [Pseudalkalibacillus hwajinpoensis]TKD70825.1 Gfo/Idh/MocA family oxidoreductase [Pseudalkalibacillus hwajinpoensis]